MPPDTSQTFECTICAQHHNLIPDALPPGHSGHRPHCVFCLLHTVYRSIIPAAPTTRPTGEQNEKNNIIKTRKLVLGTIIPASVLAYFAFRWQMKFWKHVAKGTEEGEKQWKDHLLVFMLCMVGVAPCGFLFGFFVAVVYYVYWCLKKRRKAKRKKQGQQSDANSGADADASTSVPLEERPLTELRYQDLREMSDQIKIVVTPPTESSPPQSGGSMTSKMLGAVTNRLSGGYDGRAVRRENWIAMEEIDKLRALGDRGGSGGKASRPVTEWPIL